MDGLLCVDKPAGCTSHDVVARLRRILGQPRAGHTGTLDPDATGVLLVTLGKATRLFPWLSKQDKTYRGVIRLGFSTDTYDASGRPTSEPSPVLPGEDEVRRAMASFVGEIRQTPPAYSAKKVGGRASHRLARAGRDVALEPAAVRVDAFDLLAYRPPDVEFEVRCASGTYVRSLAHDLGRALGCGAHLLSLARTAVGPFRAERCHTLEAIAEARAAGTLDRWLVRPEELLADHPAVYVDEDGARLVRHGSPLLPAHIVRTEGAPPPGEGAVFRILDPSGALIALGRIDRRLGRIAPFAVF